MRLSRGWRPRWRVSWREGLVPVGRLAPAPCCVTGTPPCLELSRWPGVVLPPVERFNTRRVLRSPDSRWNVSFRECGRLLSKSSLAICGAVWFPCSGEAVCDWRNCDMRQEATLAEGDSSSAPVC